MDGELTTPVLVRQNAFAAAVQITGFLTNAVLNVALPIMVGAALFGQFSIAIGFAYLLVGTFDTGFNNAAIRFASQSYAKRNLPEFKAQLKYLLAIKLAVSALLASALLLASDALAAAYGIPLLAPAIRLAAAVIIFMPAFNLLSSVFTAMHKNQYNFAVNIINGALLVILPITLLLLGRGILWLTGGIAFAYLAAGSIAAVLLYKKISAEAPRGGLHRIEKGRINRAIAGFSLVSVSAMFTYWGILLSLGFFAPSSEVAFFKVGLSWTQAVLALIPISTGVIFASFVSLQSRGRGKELKHYLTRIMHYSGIVIIPAMFGMFALADRFILGIYGADFARAALALKVGSWAMLALFANGILVTFYAAQERLRQLSRIYAASTLLGLGFLLFALYAFPDKLLAASISLLFVEYFKLGWLLLKAGLGAGVFAAPLAKPAIASVAMLVALYYAMGAFRSVTGTATLVLVGILAYFAALALIRGISIKDFRLLVRK